PCNLRDYSRSVHRLYVEHLRHPRVAIPLLPARGPDEPFHLSPNRSRVRAGLCGDKDDCGGLSAVAASRLAGNHCSYSGSHHRTFHVEDEGWHDRRSPKISIAFAVRNHLTGCERL